MNKNPNLVLRTSTYHALYSTSKYIVIITNQLASRLPTDHRDRVLASLIDTKPLKASIVQSKYFYPTVSYLYSFYTAGLSRST
jgi:hypothetical protein